MSDISPRRRLAGRLSIGASLLALPLTASISYAEVSGQEATSEVPPAQFEADATDVPPVTYTVKPKATVTAPPKATFTAKPKEATSSEEPRFTSKKNDRADGEKPKETLYIYRKKLEGVQSENPTEPRPNFRIRLDESKMTPEQRQKLRILRENSKDDVAAANSLKERVVKVLTQVNAEGRLTKLTVDCKIHETSGDPAASNGQKIIRSCASEDQAQTPEKGAAITNDIRAKMLARLKDRNVVRTKILSVPGESIVIGTKE